MMSKTGLQAVGLVMGVNTYYSDKSKKTYKSIDLLISGIKMPVNFRLKENADESPFVEGQLAKVAFIVKPTFDKKAIELEVA